MPVLGRPRQEHYEFKVSLRQSKFRSKHGGNGNFRTGSHPASLLSVLTKADSSLNSSAMFKKNVLAVSKNQGAGVKLIQVVVVVVVFTAPRHSFHESFSKLRPALGISPLSQV